jgi:hypothetical protein
MIASFGCYGYSRGFNVPTRFVFSVSMIAICVALWAFLAAPKSTHRLPMPYLGLFRGIMFLFTAFFLFLFQLQTFAIAIGVLAVITQIVSYYTE